MNLDERLQKDLSPDIYCLVHNKIVNLEQQCKNQEEAIDKARQCIKDFLCSEEYINVHGDAIANNYENILDILKREYKEVSE